MSTGPVQFQQKSPAFGPYSTLRFYMNIFRFFTVFNSTDFFLVAKSWSFMLECIKLHFTWTTGRSLPHSPLALGVPLYFPDVGMHTHKHTQLMAFFQVNLGESIFLWFLSPFISRRCILSAGTGPNSLCPPRHGLAKNNITLVLYYTAWWPRYAYVNNLLRVISWQRSIVARMLVSTGELSLSCARLLTGWVTSLWSSRPLLVSQHGQLSHPSLRGR